MAAHPDGALEDVALGWGEHAAVAGLDLTLVDPIGGVPGRATYPELMRFNADAFLRGLSGAAERRP